MKASHSHFTIQGVEGVGEKKPCGMVSYLVVYLHLLGVMYNNCYFYLFVYLSTQTRISTPPSCVFIMTLFIWAVKCSAKCLLSLSNIYPD